MLKQLSRLERTRSIIIIGFAVLMAVSLIVFYARVERQQRRTHQKHRRRGQG